MGRHHHAICSYPVSFFFRKRIEAFNRICCFSSSSCFSWHYTYLLFDYVNNKRNYAKSQYQHPPRVPKNNIYELVLLLIWSMVRISSNEYYKPSSLNPLN